MANPNKPAGLVPVGHLLGLDWSSRVRTYYIPSTDGNAFAIGDPVASAGDADTNGVPSVTIGVAGSAIRGVIVGIGTKEGLMADPANLDSIVIPATKTKNYYVMVVDDPFVIFECQEIGTGTYLTSAAIGLNINLVAGANNGYVSGWMLDNTTEATTSTLNCKLLGLARRSDNAFGQYAKYLVTINSHELHTGTTGV
jgi:hypothetical protein